MCGGGVPSPAPPIDAYLNFARCILGGQYQTKAEERNLTHTAGAPTPPNPQHKYSDRGSNMEHLMKVRVTAPQGQIYIYMYISY